MNQTPSKAATPPESIGQYLLCFAPLSLFEGRRRIPLAQRPLEVLALLALAKGKIVPAETIFDQVWGGYTVGRANLSQTVFLLRRALGKLEDGGEFVETVPHCGYRLAPMVFPRNSSPKGNSSELLSAELLGTTGYDSYRLLVHAIEDYAIFMLDPAGNISTWNRGAEKLYGYHALEILDKPVSLLFPAEEVTTNEPQRELSEAASLERSRTLGFCLAKSGERFRAETVMTAIRGDVGELLGFARVVRRLPETNLGEFRDQAERSVPSSE